MRKIMEYRILFLRPAWLQTLPYIFGTFLLAILGGCGGSDSLGPVSKEVPSSFEPATMADLDFLDGSSWDVGGPLFDQAFNGNEKKSEEFAKMEDHVRGNVGFNYVEFQGTNRVYYFQGERKQYGFTMVGKADKYVWIANQKGFKTGIKRADEDNFIMRTQGQPYPFPMTRLGEAEVAKRKEKFAKRYEQKVAGPASDAPNDRFKFWLINSDLKNVEARLDLEPAIIEMNELISFAIKYEKPERAQMLIERGMAFNARTVRYAGMKKQDDLVQLMMARGVEVTNSDLKEFAEIPGLLGAVWERDGTFNVSPFTPNKLPTKDLKSRLEELLKAGVPVKGPITKTGETLLKTVMFSPEAAQIVVDAGADINEGNLIKHYSRVQLQKGIEYMEFFIRNKADLPDYLLPNAIRAKNLKEIDLLLEAGLDINQPDKDGLTPLYHAVTDEWIVPHLLKKGADPNASGKDTKGEQAETPIDRAKKYNQPSLKLLEAAIK